MNDREKALRERLWRVFQSEALEHIEGLSRHLLDLEAAPAAEVAATLVEAAFREAHSLKGAARAVNVTTIESVCQAMETNLSRLKQRELAPTPELIDALLNATRMTRQLLEAEEAKTPPPSIVATIDALKKASWTTSSLAPKTTPVEKTSAPPKTSITPPSANVPPTVPSGPPSTAPRPISPPRPSSSVSELASPSSPARPDPAPPETVRISTAMLDTVRVQAEELLAEKLTAIQRVSELQQLSATFAELTRRWTPVAADIHNLAALPGGQIPASVGHAVDRLRTFADWSKTVFPAMEMHIDQTARASAHDCQTLTGKVDTLLTDTRGLLMLPFSWLLDGIRQPVRDLARDQGKEVTLVVEGEAVELDRRVLAELKAPFLHMLRNSLDHGIEAPDERQAAGKPRVATLIVRVAPAHNGRVEITVGDDGRGIDTGRLRSAIIKTGALKEDQAAALNDEEVLQWVFTSGVSTSALITDLSGRGLGLAIVREKTEKLGGAVRVESTRGHGTTLRLSVPLSLATFRGVVVRIGDYFIVFPLECVVRVTRVAAKQITTLENHETIVSSGEQLSLVRLAGALDLAASPRTSNGAGPSPVLIVAAGGLRLAFLVDEICGEQEILAKKLGPQVRLPHVAGATVLGTGRPALILDAQELVRLVVRQEESGARLPEPSTTETDAARKKSILVVDDSITSRTLLRSILESSGFIVETAVDGIDAFAKLRSTPFDLVVTDVDMPRLHGVGLTEKIRADAKLAPIPVILVTSLDSREDRERGLEAGANAYIAKRSFEESNLLDTVHRLL
jgi:two-component system chemotaxis sensor kinase CheA